MAKARKKRTPKYPDEGLRVLAALSEHFDMPAKLAKGIRQPSRPVPATPATETTTDTLDSARAWVVNEAKRMKLLGEIHEGMTKTHFAKKLAARMKAEVRSETTQLRAVGRDYVRNNLPAWGLWPISSIA